MPGIERGECMAVETSIRAATQGAAPDPVHLFCQPSKVEPKKGALPGMRPFGAGCKEEGLLKAVRWKLAFHLLHGLAGSPQYRAETCPARKKAALSNRGFGQPSRLDPAGRRPRLNSMKGECLRKDSGKVGVTESWSMARTFKSLIQKLRAGRWWLRA